MEEYELNYDDSCPKCGHSPLKYRDCIELSCEDGYIDESDENYELQGTTVVKCDTCNGSGIEQWCPKCGKDLSGYDFGPDNKKPIQPDDPDQLKLF